MDLSCQQSCQQKFGARRRMETKFVSNAAAEIKSERLSINYKTRRCHYDTYGKTVTGVIMVVTLRACASDKE